ncbi:MAG: hypothetical protein WCO66_00825 [Candidatus Absconditabacteria bacterium]
MTKKEYVRTLLQSLSLDIFPPKDELLYLLEHNTLDDTFLETLFGIFSSYVQTVNNDHIKEKLEKSVQFVKKLQSIEAEDKIQDQQDINSLDSMLANM